MNMSEIESIWSRELAEYMEERYSIDIDELIREAIRECEDASRWMLKNASEFSF